jgi:hypothetical protein
MGDVTETIRRTVLRPLPPGWGGLDHAGVYLTADETLLLVTDGVTEARNGTGAFYALAREVARAVAEDPDAAEPARLAALVRDGTLRHCSGHLADDTTIFTVRRRTAPGGDPDTARGAARRTPAGTPPGPGVRPRRTGPGR